jgi:hypothetical protein
MEDVTPESALASGTADLPSSEPPPVVEPRTIPEGGGRYDPEPERERMRGYIALGLLGMLALVLLLAFISVWVGMNAEVLRTVLTIIFGPLVTLVSAATGFYYGSRSSAP